MSRFVACTLGEVQHGDTRQVNPRDVDALWRKIPVILQTIRHFVFTIQKSALDPSQAKHLCKHRFDPFYASWLSVARSCPGGRVSFQSVSI